MTLITLKGGPKNIHVPASSATGYGFSRALTTPDHVRQSYALALAIGWKDDKGLWSDGHPDTDLRMSGGNTPMHGGAPEHVCEVWFEGAWRVFDHRQADVKDPIVAARGPFEFFTNNRGEFIVFFPDLNKSSWEAVGVSPKGCPDVSPKG